MSMDNGDASLGFDSIWSGYDGNVQPSQSLAPVQAPVAMNEESMSDGQPLQPARNEFDVMESMNYDNSFYGLEYLNMDRREERKEDSPANYGPFVKTQASMPPYYLARRSMPISHPKPIFPSKAGYDAGAAIKNSNDLSPVLGKGSIWF